MINGNGSKKLTGIKVAIAAASLVVIIAGLKAAGSLLIPFLFAGFLTIIGLAPLDWLNRKGVPKVLATLLVATFAVSILFLLATLMGSSLNDFSARAPEYREKLIILVSDIDKFLAGYEAELSITSLSESMDPGAIIEWIGVTLKGIVNTLSKSFLVIMFMIFMLVEAAVLKDKLILAFGKEAELDKLENTIGDIQRYLIIKTFTSLLTGVLIGTWTLVMDIDFPLLWGIVAFILNYVPFIGSTIAAVPAILISLLLNDLGTTLTVTVGYFIINIGVSNFLEPILMGRKLGLSVLVVFCSLVFWGWVWGPAGALMSIPLTMVVKILLENTRDLQWIAILMDMAPAKSKK